MKNNNRVNAIEEWWEENAIIITLKTYFSYFKQNFTYVMKM